jgi:hypothetical protein
MGEFGSARDEASGARNRRSKKKRKGIAHIHIAQKGQV